VCLITSLALCHHLVCVAGFKMIGGVFPVGGIPLVLGLILAVVVALTSKNDCPPIYHFVSVVVILLMVYYCYCD